MYEYIYNESVYTYVRTFVKNTNTFICISKCYVQ